jgi:hypothetical protein
MIEDQLDNLTNAFRAFIELRMEEELIILEEKKPDMLRFTLSYEIYEKYKNVLKYLR